MKNDSIFEKRLPEIEIENTYQYISLTTYYYDENQ